MLHYSDTDTGSGGDKPVLLFVHGVLMNETVWHKQVAAFKDTHRVITVDMAGFGKSPGTGAELFADHAQMIDDLLAHLDLKDVTYVGWSMGGAVGQVMAGMRPARLGRLVLYGTTPQLVADENFSDALPPEAVGELARLFESDYPKACAGFGDICAPNNAETAQFLTNIMMGTDPAVALPALASGGSQNQLGILDKITLDTHVIHGTEDTVCLPAAAAYLANNIAGCKDAVHWIETAGHGAHLSHADSFNEHLSECLG